MFAFVGTGRPSRSRQTLWASPNPPEFISSFPLVNHFYSPNDSDDDSSGGGFLPNQTPFTDHSMPFSALQQASTPSPLSDRPHLPPDDSWLAAPSDEYAEDSPYVPPTVHSTHSSSNTSLSHDLRPSSAIPRDSVDAYANSQLYDQPPDSGIDQSYSPYASEHAYSTSSRRSSGSHASRDSAFHSNGEGNHHSARTVYEPPPAAFSQTQTSSTQILPQQPYNPALYPAYDQNNQRIGLEHTRPDAMKHIPTGRPYYRAQTSTYGVRASPPQPDHQPRGVAAVQQPPASQSLQSPAPPRPSRRPLPPQPVRPAPAAHPPRQTFSSQIPIDEIPDPEPSLRQMLGMGPNEEISLAVLDDPPPGEKPNYPYPTLAKLAIHGSERKKLTLQEIYSALEDRFEWFRQRSSSDTAWKRSIRHLLSLNKTFRKIPRPVTDPGKGSYWIVDYSQGEGNKRLRKRNKKPTKAQLARQAAEAEKARQAEQYVTAGSAAGPSHHSRSDSEGSPSSRRSMSGGFDESAIDPALSAQGHRVGMQRPTPRNRLRANPPYPSSSNEGSGPPDSSRRTRTSTGPASSVTRGGLQFAALGDRPSALTQTQPAFGRSYLGTPVVAPATVPSAFGMATGTNTSASASQLQGATTATSSESAPAASSGFSGYRDGNVSLLQGRSLRASSRGGRAAASARASSSTFHRRNTSDSSGSEGREEDRTYFGSN